VWLHYYLEMHLFEGTTADEVWLMAASKFEEAGIVHEQASRAGLTRELLGAAFTIKNPRQRWTTSRQPAMNPAFAIAEVVWIVSGRHDASFLNYWNPKLPQFAGNDKNYHGAYGFRLRRHLGLDQLERAYQALSNNPDTRQVVLQIWDSSVDFPLADGSPASPDIPCNICSFAKIRDGKLEWTQILRSNDLFLGVPHNFVQFTSLQEILAAWLGIEVGHYRHISDCLHIYVRDQNHVRETGHTNCEENTDVLRFTKAESDVFFAEMSKRMDRMTNMLLTQRKLGYLARPENFPKELRNWLLVVAADCARRRQWINLSYELMAECSNPALKQLWDRWLARWWTMRQEETVSNEAVIYAQPWLPLKLA
jgi:thymidylate synthase